MATAAPASGTSYLVPLSFPWDGATVVIEGAVQAVAAPPISRRRTAAPLAAPAAAARRGSPGGAPGCTAGPAPPRAGREARALPDRPGMGGGDGLPGGPPPRRAAARQQRQAAQRDARED